MAWWRKTPCGDSRRMTKRGEKGFCHHINSPPGSSLAGGSLWQLQEVVTKMTGKNAVLNYSSYGCYCGVGGHGQPKDATDR